MGSTKPGGMPLYSGMQLSIAGKDVEVESQISAALVPRIIGSLPPDCSYEDEGADFKEDISEAFGANLPMKATILSCTFKENLAAEEASLATSEHKKFVTPTSFYGQPQQPKAPKPMHVFSPRHAFDVMCCSNNSLAMIPMPRAQS